MTIAASSGNVVQWFKLLRYGRQKTIRFTELNGAGLEERTRSSGNVHSIAFEVWLYGEEGSLRIFTASRKHRAKEELDRILTVTGLPELEPPSREIFSSRVIIGIIAVVLLIPVLMFGLFILLQFAK